MEASMGPLQAWVEYLRDIGVHDLYRRGQSNASITPASDDLEIPQERLKGTTSPSPMQDFTPPSASVGPAPQGVEASTILPKARPFSVTLLAPLPASSVPLAERPAELVSLRNEIGDCVRCPLAYAGRHKIVFGNGDPGATLMFVGEGPGADEDITGEPFVGKAGQLLDNMIQAMGLQRGQVYVANIVKCRPPANRVPEPVEAKTCSQFLLRQIDIIQPRVIVALGATAALYLLGIKKPLAALRGEWHECRGAKLAVTYHPAFLLRDPRQKGEAWKDLQMVMAELGLKGPERSRKVEGGA